MFPTFRPFFPAFFLKKIVFLFYFAFCSLFRMIMTNSVSFWSYVLPNIQIVVPTYTNGHGDMQLKSYISWQHGSMSMSVNFHHIISLNRLTSNSAEQMAHIKVSKCRLSKYPILKWGNVSWANVPCQSEQMSAEGKYPISKWANVGWANVPYQGEQMSAEQMSHIKVSKCRMSKCTISKWANVGWANVPYKSEQMSAEHMSAEHMSAEQMSYRGEQMSSCSLSAEQVSGEQMSVGEQMSSEQMSYLKFRLSKCRLSICHGTLTVYFIANWVPVDALRKSSQQDLWIQFSTVPQESDDF